MVVPSVRLSVPTQVRRRHFDRDQSVTWRAILVGCGGDNSCDRPGQTGLGCDEKAFFKRFLYRSLVAVAACNLI